MKYDGKRSTKKSMFYELGYTKNMKSGLFYHIEQ